jgi:prepilin-type N-terminal cleavage/methylation domain-containing protein
MRNYLNKQSAFSLIELLVALLILSVGVMGAGKLLLNSTQSWALAIQQEHAITIVGAVADAVSLDPTGRQIANIRQYWQQHLDKNLPGSILDIHTEIVEKRCWYTVRLIFPSSRLKTLQLKVSV